MKPFANVSDAYRKLSRSLVTYSGVLYQCSPTPEDMARADGKMTIKSLVGNEVKVVNYTDNSFQVVSYELGFLNHLKSLSCIYVFRSPARNSHVGIDLSALSYYEKGTRARQLTNNFIYGEFFQDMIHNKYPTFDTVFDLMSKSKKDGAGVAFGKHLALYKRLSEDDEYKVVLHSGTSVIAELDMAEKKLIVPSNKKFVISMLVKSGAIPSEIL